MKISVKCKADEQFKEFKENDDKETKIESHLVMTEEKRKQSQKEEFARDGTR